MKDDLDQAFATISSLEMSLETQHKREESLLLKIAALTESHEKLARKHENLRMEYSATSVDMLKTREALDKCRAGNQKLAEQMGKQLAAFQAIYKSLPILGRIRRAIKGDLGAL